MILKKGGFSCFLWGAFSVSLVFLAALFWYFSQLLPDESRAALSAVLSLLTLTAVCLIAFCGGRLADFLHARLHPDPQAAGIIGDLFAGVLLLAVFLIRILYLSAHVADIADPEGLFAAAMISAEDAQMPESAAAVLSLRFLRVFLRIAGNRIIAAAVAMAALQTVMVIGYYFAVRLLSGRTAAFVAAGITGFLPVLFRRLIAISAQSMLFALFSLMLLLIALYLHFDAAGAYGKPWQIAWFLAIGAALGGLIYLDFAAVLLWIPLLFAIALPGTSRGAELVRLLLILAASAAVLFLMLARESGGIVEAVKAYVDPYYGETMAVRLFHLPLDSYPFHIALVTAMALLVVTFWRDRLRDRSSLWLAFMLAAVFLVPLFGASRLNAQELLCFSFAAVTGVGAACLFSSGAWEEQAILREAAIGKERGMEEQGRPEMVPEGMVLPAESEADEGESRMRMPDSQTMWKPLGLDRGEVEGADMSRKAERRAPQEAQKPQEPQETQETQKPQQAAEEEARQAGTAGQSLTRAEQKALAKAQKAKARADAKAQKAEAKAAKKAEKERLRMLADAEEEAEELAARGLLPQGAPVLLQPDGVPQMPSAAAAQTAAIAQPAAPAAQTAAPETVQTMFVQPPVDPVQPVSLAAISPFAGRAPQTSQPNLVRNTAFNPDGSDDFDYEINGDDDFDV